MPDVYENYTAFEHSRQKLHGASAVVPRDTSYFADDYDPRTISTTGTSSPSFTEYPGFQQIVTYNSLTSTSVLDMTSDLVPHNIIEQPINRVEIQLLVQPVDKLRMRYLTEKNHGKLSGETEIHDRHKKFPTVKLINCRDKNAVIRCTLVTADEKRLLHAHRLVVINENTEEMQDDPHDVEVSDLNNYTAMFSNMRIIHSTRKEMKEEIIRKRTNEILDDKRKLEYQHPIITTIEETELKKEAGRALKSMNTNTVCLCFQGFRYGQNNALYPITEKIYSRPINNLKSVETGELRICRLDKCVGSCKGGEEVWILVDRVDKNNIKVKFYEYDESDNVVWEAEGEFTELDVHHQYAIVFKTPEYKNTNITKPATVFVRLLRPSDGAISNSRKFEYKPVENILSRKRPRIVSASTSLEIQSNTIPVEKNFTNSVTEEIMTLPVDEIPSLSQEIEKLIHNTECSSQEVEEFIQTNKSDLERYLSINFDEGIEKDSNNLVPDGKAVTKIMKPQDFAIKTLNKIFNIYTEMESNGKTMSLMIDIKNLLKETTNFGDSSLHFALRLGKFETAKWILACIASDPMFESTINLQNDAGQTPLHLAACQDQSEIIRTLLKLGADPNICDEKNFTSMHTAVIAEANSSIQELLQSNIKLNLKAHTDFGWSALHLGTKGGSLYAVKALINAGADVSVTEMSYGRTALHIAVESNHAHIVTYLLTETKINVNAKNFGGNTALHTAVAKGGKYAEELVKILRVHGADSNIKNNNTNAEEWQGDHIRTTTSISSAIGKEFGESSFDLVPDNAMLIQLLGQQKEELESEIPHNLQQRNEKVTDLQIERISVVLDRTDGWVKLAQHTNNASLVRLFKKTLSPSSALLKKIQLQNPDMTVSQLKKLLIEVQAFKAVTILDQQ